MAIETDTQAADAPMFEPEAWGLSDQERDLTALARSLGQTKIGPRAARYDRDAAFPMENYRDMHAAGLMGICIPKENGGHGAGLRSYAIVAAEIGRYCGSTALTWNMHVCSTLWSGALVPTFTNEGQHRYAAELRWESIMDSSILTSG